MTYKNIDGVLLSASVAAETPGDRWSFSVQGEKKKYTNIWILVYNKHQQIGLWLIFNKGNRLFPAFTSGQFLKFPL